jgi:hypothetical protein
MLLAMLGMLPEANACDRCACGATNYYVGILPQYHRSFVGFRYRHSLFETTGHHDADAVSTETFQSAELWGRFYPTRRIQVLAFVPYQFNRQSGGGVSEIAANGLGDAAFLGSYRLLDATKNGVKHQLWAGGGLKMPTGTYNPGSSGLNNPNFQKGTGSWDVLFNAQYTLRLAKWGVFTDLNYRINTTNSYEYKYGNRMGAVASVFYIRDLATDFAVMPNAGMYYENSSADKKYGYIQDETGGYLTAAQLGLDVYFLKNFAVQSWVLLPVDQHLQAGYTQAKPRWMVGLSCMF